MAHTLDRCEHDGIKWFPRVTIEKYSPDQSAFAEGRLADALSWRRLPVLRRVAIGERASRVRDEHGLVYRIHGDWLRELFPGGPEDGYARTEGNLLVAGGLANLAYLLLGTTPSGSNGRVLAGTTTTGQTVCGVGSTSTTATVADTHLGADGTAPNGTVGAYYQAMDSTYPSWAGSGTANGGQLNGQSTYASGNANMNWQEWCWATGIGAITAGSTLASVFATGADTAMLNHWSGTSLGTKGSGATWVFSTTITFS